MLQKLVRVDHVKSRVVKLQRVDITNRERNVVLAATLTQFISLDDHSSLRVNANDPPGRNAFGQIDGDGARPAANIQQLLSWLERIKKVAGGVLGSSPYVAA